MHGPGSKALRKGRRSGAERFYYLTKNLLDKKSDLLVRPNHAEIAINRFFWAREKRWFNLLAFVVMPNHYHLVIQLGLQRTLEETMQQVNRLASREINTLSGSRGTIWQDGLYDRRIRPHEDINDYVTYVHMNPVRKKLVEKMEDWPWSSAHARYRDEIRWEWDFE